MNELVLLEEQLKPLAPQFAEVLPAVLPPDRLIRTVVVSCEKTPKLLKCNRQSLFNAAMSAAILGLEVDGITGQGFLIPFGQTAQLVIGYKGYNTLGARSGLTITGEVVREGDTFDYELGSDAFVRHKPSLGTDGRIIAAWACARAQDRPPVIAVMGIGELNEVKRKSPGAAKSDSPWNDPTIGFPAMCSKTVKRRLARSTPLNAMQVAARMEEAFEEQGKPSWIDRDRGLIIDGTQSKYELTDPPTAEELTSDRSAVTHARLAAAAEQGYDALKETWNALDGDTREETWDANQKIYIPRARAVDKAKGGGQ